MEGKELVFWKLVLVGNGVLETSTKIGASLPVGELISIFANFQKLSFLTY